MWNREKKKTLSIVICLGVSALLLLACSSQEHLAGAEKAVQMFHRQLDEGRYVEVYDTATQEFRASLDQAHFIEYMQGVHEKLGSFKSTKRTTWNEQLGTGGHRLTMAYESTYSNGPATERFIFQIEDSGPKLLRYDVNSTAFLSR